MFLLISKYTEGREALCRMLVCKTKRSGPTHDFSEESNPSVVPDCGGRRVFGIFGWLQHFFV